MAAEAKPPGELEAVERFVVDNDGLPLRSNCVVSTAYIALAKCGSDTGRVGVVSCAGR